MPITLHQMAANTATITITWQTNTVTVEYRPGLVTERIFAKLNAFSKMDQTTIEAGFADYNMMLAQLIKSWDVYEDDAETVMFPIDPDRFSELPIGFRVSILQGIMSDIRPESVAPQTT